MGRKKKDGRRSTGIQSKNGYLYIVTSTEKYIDGTKKHKKTWIKTGLPDTPQNVKLVVAQREKLMTRTVPLSPEITLSILVNQYLSKKKEDLADTTYAKYGQHAKHIQNYFGETKLKTLSEDSINGFISHLFVECGLQPRSVTDIKMFLGSVLEVAYNAGIIPFNFARAIKITKARKKKYTKNVEPGETFFSYDEAMRFLTYAQGHKLYPLFYITLVFGLRRSEVLGLTWSAFDLKRKTLRICRTVTRGTTVNHENGGKTETSIRDYPLNDKQVELFVKLKQAENENKTIFGDAYYSNDYIFKHESGKQYYPDYPSKQFKKIVKMHSDLPQSITFHGLRTSCISLLVHYGLDIKRIQHWVGHADYETTLKVYAKVKNYEAKLEVSDEITKLIPIYSDDKF